MDTPSRSKRIVPLRWLARLWATGLVLFWGAFLAEHLLEWIVRAETLPPTWVLSVMVAHFALVVGLVLGWRWEMLGGALVLVSASLLLPGHSEPRLAPLFMLATIVPGGIWLALGGYEAGRRLGTQAETDQDARPSSQSATVQSSAPTI